MGMDFFIPPFKGAGDESVGDFVRRRLGSEALEKIAEPMMSGIHVSDPEKQSLLATFPRFRKMEQSHGSLIKGMLSQRKNSAQRKMTTTGKHSMFVSMKEGLSQLSRKIGQALKDGEVIQGHQVTHVARQDNGMYLLTLDDSRQISADAVILATPSYVSADLIRPLAPKTAEKLASIRYVSTATVSLAFRKKDLEQQITGFGYVAPRKEGRKISACTFSSIKFDNRSPADSVLVRCFIGGPNREEFVSLSDEQITAMVRQELKEILNVQAQPIFTRIYRWEKANPQYDVNHIEKVADIFAEMQAVPGLYLTGSAYEGVGVPDCIHQGQQAAEKALQFVTQSVDIQNL